VAADEAGGHHVRVLGPGEIGVADRDAGVALLELLDVVLDRLDRIAPAHEVELDRGLRRGGAAAEQRGAETEGGPAAEYVAAVESGAATRANEPAAVLSDHSLLLFADERATGAASSRRSRRLTDE